MSILVDQNTKVLIQGITGKEASRACRFMLDYGTKVLCGVTPGKGGEMVEGVPVYHSVSEALEHFPEVNCAMISVPPASSWDAVAEAIEHNIPLINIMTETIPIHDSAKMLARAREKNIRLVGPASVGIMSPGKAKVGFIGGPTNQSFTPGPVGIISKSGGMCSETALELTHAGIGQSTVVGIGGDVIIGSTFVDLLELFEEDIETKIIVLYGEIGGTYEQDVALCVKNGKCTKPVVAFISGKFAGMIRHIPLGHAGAIIEGDLGTREAKIESLQKAGVHVVDVHNEIAPLVKNILFS